MASSRKNPQQSEPQEYSTTHAEVESFEQIASHMNALHQEFAVQAKSKPDNVINKFKVKMLNEKLALANSLLAGSFKPFADFTAFNDVDLPSNSDVALVLNTYLASLERWRSARVFFRDWKWYWRTTAGPLLGAESPTMYTPKEK
ncbi:MAG TPA: hypothetical protein VGJ18_00130 [Gemmatimonadaceae bacterium]|jgi:hypothetical protein